MRTESKCSSIGVLATIGILGISVSAFSASPPYAATQPAAPVRATTATLTGMATPGGEATTAWFEWGGDRSYGYVTTSVDAGNGERVVRISARLEGLITGTVYHFRLVASNSLGVTFGADQAFTTGMKLAVWGNQFGIQPYPPRGLTSLVSVVSGHNHAMGVRNDGTVVSWAPGTPLTSGITDLPLGLSNVVALAGGWYHSLALLEDGTVVSWGWFASPYKPVYVPAGLTNVVAIAAGDSHSLALKEDGTVVAWGSNIDRQTNQPPGLTNVVAISAGSTHSIALKADGKVVSWGSGAGSQSPPASLSNVVSIASETWHNLALRRDGTVVAWGDTSNNKCAVPPGLSNVVAVAAGFEHSLALKADGSLVAWGNSTYLNSIPIDVREAIAIVSGDYHSQALTPANLKPYPYNRSVAGLPNRDILITLSGRDPNGDGLRFLLGSAPTNGTLYQYTEVGRGEPISASGAAVTDSAARLLYAPMPDALGAPFDGFGFVASDGAAESSPGWVKINVVTEPVIASCGLVPTNPASFVLSFSGFSNATYRLQISTNLIHWTPNNPARQVSPGQFEFIDTPPANVPKRFYRLMVQ